MDEVEGEKVHEEEEHSVGEEDFDIEEDLLKEEDFKEKLGETPKTPGTSGTSGTSGMDGSMGVERDGPTPSSFECPFTIKFAK